ncbi:MAG: gamma carbonic anhydrase family protein [Proteobacteria bacterium]|nr:gamma carbonic anhydrase family protein [Cystobacterineae bacterium]MCL2259287.1 gamma carbonic anhydrase family protein [Cystobacterineae bacterium]MCL2314313.1 gamma carbonic anhydrase family protein [Pseudomonadota bacterium]
MPIESFTHFQPSVHPLSFLHPSALLIGEVYIEEAVSVWPYCVLRGDCGALYVGKGSNLQESCILHATTHLSSVQIGENCTVGHRALLHGCRVGEGCLVGMGAILLDNCQIGPWSIVGAGTLVPANKTFAPRSLLVGSPARVVRPLTDEEVENLQLSAQNYWKLAQTYLQQAASKQNGAP